jgi:CheY-like chemotaxis protein
VRDNGIGIAREQLPGVFDMFFQGGNGKLAAGGLGIGLALARQLVELHGGSIEARSEGAGRGSEFTVRVPLPISPAIAREAAPARAPERARRVLIADDNVDAAQSLGMLLRKMGHAVQLSHDGAAALEIALREPPEIVLLDIDMPKLDGFAVATRLRADQRFDRVPIVALTGLGQDVDRMRAREAGFDQHVLKPMDFSALREALDLIRAKGETSTAVSDG